VQRRRDNRSRPDRPRGGWTLVELLVVIAIFTLLVLGVSHVYRSFTQVVGATHSLSGQARDSRGAHSMLYNDLKLALTQHDPYFLIVNERRSAFLRNQDYVDDADRNPDTVDLDGDGAITAPGEDLASQPASRNFRNCRTDMLGFFIRDAQYKHTGSGDQLVSPMGGCDAYVWYGHLEMADSRGSGAYFAPGASDIGANTNNYFSSDWILGRRMLLVSEHVTDRTGATQVAIDQPGAGPLPLSYDSIASTEPNAQLKTIQSSRNDLVKATVYDMHEKVRDLIVDDANADWWSSLLYRFRAVPVPQKPLSGEGVALSAPVFLPRCRQFMVEFAGDFVTQATDVRGLKGSASSPDGKITAHDLFDPRYGEVLAAVPDGKIDFYTVPGPRQVTLMDKGAANEDIPTPYAERIERVRFYGLPRDPEATGAIPGGGTGRSNNDLYAVVPLRDVVRTGAANDPALGDFQGAPFERIVPPAAADYARPGALAPNSTYVCVFGPDDPRPKILRIVVTLEDPVARTGVGQTHEYVLQLNR
jgi:prepilin-type N-terminal cleavage/methylation domain-containing protein